jgi:hypothetical protein
MGEVVGYQQDVVAILFCENCGALSRVGDLPGGGLPGLDPVAGGIRGRLRGIPELPRNTKK